MLSTTMSLNAWIVEHTIVNVVGNGKEDSKTILGEGEGVDRGGGNENHHFVEVTRVEQFRCLLILVTENLQVQVDRRAIWECVDFQMFCLNSRDCQLVFHAR